MVFWNISVRLSPSYKTPPPRLLVGIGQKETLQTITLERLFLYIYQQ